MRLLLHYKKKTKTCNSSNSELACVAPAPGDLRKKEVTHRTARWVTSFKSNLYNQFPTVSHLFKTCALR